MYAKLLLYIVLVAIIISSYSLGWALPSTAVPHTINPALIKEVTTTPYPRIAAPSISVQRQPVKSTSDYFFVIQDDTCDIIVPLDILKINWLFLVNKPDCRYLVALEPTSGVLRALKLPLDWLGYQEPRFLASSYLYNNSFLIQFDKNDYIELKSGTVVWGKASGTGMDYLPVTITNSLQIYNLNDPWYGFIPEVLNTAHSEVFINQVIKSLDNKPKLVINYKDKPIIINYEELKRNGLIPLKASGSNLIACYFTSINLPVVFENKVRFRDNTTRKLEFNLTANGLQDAETLSLWDRRGRCINGRRNMQGIKLYRIDSYILYNLNNN